MSRPLSIPSPRKLSIEDRFALSKDDLNTKSSPASFAAALHSVAIIIAWSNDSITHGPAITVNRPSPKVALPTLKALVTGFVLTVLPIFVSKHANVGIGKMLLTRGNSNKEKRPHPPLITGLPPVLQNGFLRIRPAFLKIDFTFDSFLTGSFSSFRASRFSSGLLELELSAE